MLFSMSFFISLGLVFAPSFRQPKIFSGTILVRENLCFALASFDSVRRDQEGAIIVVTGIRRRDV